MTLQRNQQVTINAEIQAYRKQLEIEGRVLSRGYDWRQFVELRRRFPDQKVHPAFNPEAGLGPAPGEFLWIGMWEGDQIVGLVASRKFDGPLARLLDTRELWGLGPDFTDLNPFPIPDTSDIPPMEGVITLQGGAVLASHLQGRGIQIPQGNLIRLMSFRHWAEDWQIALHLTKTDPNRVRFSSYGYSSGQEILFDRPVEAGPNKAHSREIIAWVSKQKILADLAMAGRRVGTPLRLAVG